jgi:hypothetical protein
MFSAKLAVTVVLAHLSLCSAVDTNSTIDPFKDPKDDIRNPLRYIPSNALSAVALGKRVSVFGICPTR